MTSQPILVIGATGKTGSRVVSKLENAGVSVRRGSRGSQIPFDWDTPATWAPALSGVSKAYVTYFPDLAFPNAVETLDAFTKTAAASGLEHLVLLSGRGEEGAGGICECQPHGSPDRWPWSERCVGRYHCQPARMGGL